MITLLYVRSRGKRGSAHNGLLTQVGKPQKKKEDNMSKATPRINGRKCRPYVQERKAFTNSNGQLYAVRHTPLLYVVYSYGDHWPLFVHDGFDWYENEDKYSPTTTRHRSNANPYAPTIKRSCTWLKNFISEHKGHYRALNDVQSTLGLAA